MNISIEEMPREIARLEEENERLQEELDKIRLSELDKEYRIDKAIETLKDEGLVVAIKIINEKNDEILLSSKDLLIDILKGNDKE